MSRCGDVAQMGERCVRNAQVEGSNPFISTILRPFTCVSLLHELSLVNRVPISAMHDAGLHGRRDQTKAKSGKKIAE